MKKPIFAIFSANYTENTKDLVEEIQARGYEVSILRMSDIVLDFSENAFKMMHQGVDVEKNFDIFLFRSYMKLVASARIIAEKLLSANKTVIDEVLGKRSTGGKMFQASRMAQNNIPQIRTFQAHSLEAFENEIRQYPFPIIAKPIVGSKGNGILKWNTIEEALEGFQTLEESYLFQEYVPITSDIRVFVVGDKVLGAMRRFVVDGDFRSNAALGSKTEIAQLTPELENLALQAAKVMEYEVAGVDIVEHDEKYSVLEINNTPEWQAFKKTTGINPAPHIIQYALEKYTSKQAQ